MTSAASCQAPIKIGTDVCDPWGRLFNQNPNVGELFRRLNLTNVDMVGLVSILAFALVFFFSVKFFRVENFCAFAVLVTPMFILALDRGNEIITITLVAIGIIALHRSEMVPQIVGSAVLVFAVILKLWPILLIFFLLFYQWARINIFARLLLIAPFIYWSFKISEIKSIVETTQVGSPFGTSFGLSLFTSSRMNLTQLFTLLLVTLGFTAMLVKFSKKSLADFLYSSSGIKVVDWVVPVMLTYVAIWAAGDSFVYRMIILLPLVFVLSSSWVIDHSWSRFVLSAILVTLITSRLPVTLAVSSSLALYFIYVSFKAWRVGTSALRM